MFVFFSSSFFSSSATEKQVTEHVVNQGGEREGERDTERETERERESSIPSFHYHLRTLLGNVTPASLAIAVILQAVLTVPAIRELPL